MGFPERNLNQTAVYWGTPVADGYGGFTYADAVEINCRWVGSTQTILDSHGEQLVSRATVQVDQDVDEDGLLYLGTLDELDSADEVSPENISGAYRIRRFDKTPNMQGTSWFRVAYL